MSTNELLRPETTYQAVLGRVIVKVRKGQGMEQGLLAKNVGVTQSTWSRIERGESSLNIEQLARASDFLGIKPSYILSETENAVESLELQGVIVNKNKNTTNDNHGIALIGAAALGALVATAIAKK